MTPVLPGVSPAEATPSPVTRQEDINGTICKGWQMINILYNWLSLF